MAGAGGAAGKILSKIDYTRFFPLVTLLLIVNALFYSAIAVPPFLSPFISGLPMLLFVTAKYFIGKVVAKVPGAEQLGMGENREDMMSDLATGGKGQDLGQGKSLGDRVSALRDRLQTAKQTAQAVKTGAQAAKVGIQGAKAGVSAAVGTGTSGIGTVVQFVIEYLITPMGKFEKIALAFGWASWPVALVFNFATVFTVFCTGTDVLTPFVSICNF